MKKKSIIDSITNKKLQAPVELLIAIVNPVKSNKVFEILDSMQEKNSLAVMASGTADSNLLDLFGFAFTERTAIMAIVATKKGEELVNKIADELQFNTPEFSGVAFTVPINSMEKTFLNSILKGDWNE